MNIAANAAATITQPRPESTAAGARMPADDTRPALRERPDQDGAWSGRSRTESAQTWQV
ncbi:hypothetical protein GCM10027300_31330 [Modestobacter lapidis]